MRPTNPTFHRAYEGKETNKKKKQNKTKQKTKNKKQKTKNKTKQNKKTHFIMAQYKWKCS